MFEIARNGRVRAIEIVKLLNPVAGAPEPAFA